MNNNSDNILTLSSGEHSIEEVAHKAGMVTDQDLMQKGVCPSCYSTKTHTTNDYFDYCHSEYIFGCDSCGYTAGGF